MHALVPSLNAWSASWSQFMLAVLWQSTLLAAAVAVIAWLARRASPTVRYWLWQIVAIKLLLAPLWTLWLPLAWLPAKEPAAIVAENPRPQALPLTETDRAGEVSQSESDLRVGPDDRPLLPLASDPADDAAVGPIRAYERAPKTPSSQSLGWSAWLMVAWGGIVAGQTLLLVWQRIRLGRFLSKCTLADERLAQVVGDVAQSIGLRRVPSIRLSDVDCSPFVCGLIKPTLVLPRVLAELFCAGELRPVIVHELAHLKRGDLWFGWAPIMARVIYFFHPVAHWAAFRVRLEAELACDGWAMNATGQGPAAYADLLVRVVSRLSEPAMLRPAAALDGQASMDRATSPSTDHNLG